MHYEADDISFSAYAYEVDGYSGVAWWALGWETQPDEDTEWTGIEERTERVVCVMVGDDRHFVFDYSEMSPLDENDFCGGCGQIGCTAERILS